MTSRFKFLLLAIAMAITFIAVITSGSSSAKACGAIEEGTSAAYAAEIVVVSTHTDRMENEVAASDKVAKIQTLTSQTDQAGTARMSGHPVPATVHSRGSTGVAMAISRGAPTSIATGTFPGAEITATARGFTRVAGRFSDAVTLATVRNRGATSLTFAALS